MKFFILSLIVALMSISLGDYAQAKTVSKDKKKISRLKKKKRYRRITRRIKRTRNRNRRIARANTSKAMLPIITPRTLPVINLDFTSTISTNFDKKSEEKKSTVSHAIGADTLFKAKPFNNFEITNFPEFDLEYAPSRTNEKLTNFEFENEINALYKSSDVTLIKGKSEHGYTNNFSFNDKQEFIKKQFYFASLEGALDNTVSGSVHLNTMIGTKFEDYTTPSSVSNPDQDDNLKFYGEIAPEYRFSAVSNIKLPISVERKMARTKKSLLKAGQEGGSFAETLDYYKILIKSEFARGALVLKPAIGLHKQIDQEHGAKNFGGYIIKLKATYGNNDIAFMSELTNEKKSYSNQMVTTSAAEGKSPLLDLNTFEFENNLEFKQVFNKVTSLGFGHKLEQNKSNRSKDDTLDQKFKIFFKMTL